MKEFELYYNAKTKHDLKDPYPRFYYSMLDFISSLPDQWFFKECYVVESDGSLFHLILHDGRNHILDVSAVRNGSSYDFNYKL